jgi:peroxiredoxin
MTISRKILNALFVLLLINSLCVSVPVVGATEFPATAEETMPLESGDSAPSFTVQTVANENFSFEPDALQNPVVLISFRGGWCPYCNMHLSELRTVIPEIEEMGFDVYFISNDRPEMLYSSLKNETKEAIATLDYTILSDANLNAASAFGTAFMAPDALVAWLDSTDKDYDDSSIAKHGALAVPSVYVIDTDGMIVYDYANADYKVRLEADDLLAAAQEAHSN